MAGVISTVPDVSAIVTAAHATTDGKLNQLINRELFPFSFESLSDDVIDLGPSEAADVDLPNVVVAGIPAGATVLRVVAYIKVRAIENTSASAANAIQGAQAIRVKQSTKSWGDATYDLAAIDLPDNLWTVAASTRESGDVLIGDNDVKVAVPGNGTFNLRFENQVVDYDQLRLNDVMVGLRFYLQSG